MKTSLITGWRLVARQGKLFAGIAIGITAIVLAAPTIVRAAIPDGNGRVYACATTGGILPHIRIADNEDGSCDEDELALNWVRDTSLTTSNTLMQQKLTQPHADLYGMHVTFMDLRNKTFEGTTFTYGNFSGSDFSGSTFRNLVSVSGSFDNANLRNTTWIGPVTGSLSFPHGSLEGADFTQASVESLTGYDGVNTEYKSNARNIAFDGATLAAPNGGWSGLDLRGSTFVGTTISYNYFDYIDFSNIDFSNATFATAPTYITNSNLTGAVFGTADFSSTTWANVICPDGTHSDNNQNGSCIGHL